MPTLFPRHPLIPAHLPGNLKVLEAFRTLPPETRVFVGVRLPDPGSTGGHRDLDFLVADPELGLVLVKVLADGVRYQASRWSFLNAAGQEEMLEASPAEDLLAQQNALFTFLKRGIAGFVPRITQVLAVPGLALEPGRALGPKLPACRLLTGEKLRNPFISLRLAVTEGRPWTEWCTTPLAGQFAIGGGTLEQLSAALRATGRPG